MRGCGRELRQREDRDPGGQTVAADAAARTGRSRRTGGASCATAQPEAGFGAGEHWIRRGEGRCGGGRGETRRRRRAERDPMREQATERMRLPGVPPRLPAAEDAARRGRVHPCQLSRPRQQGTRGSKRAPPLSSSPSLTLAEQSRAPPPPLAHAPPPVALARTRLAESAHRRPRRAATTPTLAAHAPRPHHATADAPRPEPAEHHRGHPEAAPRRATVDGPCPEAVQERHVVARSWPPTPRSPRRFLRPRHALSSPWPCPALPPFAASPDTYSGRPCHHRPGSSA
ncbi:uncharacterized protein [Miscanthus floridulus]|uniref:uncharacterized protein n=1 Tax=Miscanthus floridulus TaxID=154761 RepID=UPI003459620D